MHEHATPDNVDFMDEDDGTNDPGYREDGQLEPTEMTEDELEEEDCAPEQYSRERNEHAQGMRMRNRINLFLRSVEMRSCSFWERSHRLHVVPIMADNDRAGRQDLTGLSSWGCVCAAFAVPLRLWDEESYHAFCATVNEYLEQTQNGEEEDRTGLL